MKRNKKSTTADLDTSIASASPAGKTRFYLRGYHGKYLALGRLVAGFLAVGSLSSSAMAKDAALGSRLAKPVPAAHWVPLPSACIFRGSVAAPAAFQGRPVIDAAKPPEPGTLAPVDPGLDALVEGPGPGGGYSIGLFGTAQDGGLVRLTGSRFLAGGGRQESGRLLCYDLAAFSQASACPGPGVQVTLQERFLFAAEEQRKGAVDENMIEKYDRQSIFFFCREQMQPDDDDKDLLPPSFKGAINVTATVAAAVLGTSPPAESIQEIIVMPAGPEQPAVVRPALVTVKAAPPAAVPAPAN